MTFPEHVVERVAAAIRQAYADDAARGDTDLVGDVSEWRGEAVAALSALGFRRQVVPGVVHVNTRWVAMTEWEQE